MLRSARLRAARALVALLALPVVVLCSAPAHAQATLVTGLGGPAGFGTNVLTVGDDNSSVAIPLAPYNLSGLCLYGTTHTQLYINNNGNVTFDGPVSTYTPSAFPVSTNPMIAPFWGDVDTRGTAPTNEDRVYWDIRSGQLVVTWYRVGFYNQHPTPYNTFQLVIRQIAGASDYDIEFRYAALNWTTGDASGGSGGTGGTPAQAGFDAGDTMHYNALPGSRTPAITGLLTTSNATPPQPGLWTFRMRSCVLGIPCTSNAQCGGNTPICDTTQGLCRPCNPSNATDCTGSTPVCLTTGTAAGSCVQCTAGNTSACTGTTPVCNTTTNVCRACNPATPTDCVAPTPVCATTGSQTGACVQCAAGSTGACVAPTPVCDTSSDTCRGCLTNANCSGGTPICDAATHVCRACNPSNATDCSGATPACATSGAANGRCVQCTSVQPMACTGATPVCNPTTDVCVGCLTNTDCPSTAPTCDAATHVCRPCVTDGDCGGSTPACALGRCVQCTATNRTACTGMQVCNVAANVCVGCVSNSDCSGSTPICDTGAHMCRPCDPSNAADCSGATPVCATMGSEMGTCVGCETNSSCAAPTPVCNTTTDTCVGCNTNDDCSGATPICDLTVHACRPCAANSECSGATPACAMDGANAGRCVECATGAKMACMGKTPVCDTTADRCVLCTPGPSGDATACASSDDGHACVAAAVSTDPSFCGCATDADCGNATSGRICETTTHLCVDGCWPGTGHNGCPTGEFCSSIDPTMSGHCSTTCTADRDCPTAHPHCLAGSAGMSSSCVDCITDPDCAGNTDGRTRCIGDDHTCEQCTPTDTSSCHGDGAGAACLNNGLCGCSMDSDCAADRRCNTGTQHCEPRGNPDGGTDGGADASRDGATDSGHGDAAMDGARDGGGGGVVDAGPSTLSGNGACACRAAGSTGAGGSDAARALLALGVALGLATARRRTRR